MTGAGSGEGRGMGRISDDQHAKDEQVFASFIESASWPRRARVARAPGERPKALTPGLPPDYDTDDQAPDLIED
jgi:hypothetical protein